MDGIMRKQNIVTLGVKVWHVLEYDHFELEETSYGQFHDGDTYVVRWQYMITTGRVNCCNPSQRMSDTHCTLESYYYKQCNLVGYF